MLQTVNQHRSATTSSQPVGVVAVLYGIGILSLLAGLLATTASPLLIGVFAGVILGIGLLARLDLALWLVVVGTLLIGGSVQQFAPQLGKAVWLFSMVGFLLLFGSILQLVAKRSLGHGLPWFAWLALVFPLYAVLVTFANVPSAVEFLAGFKRYFQFWGVFAALVLFPFSQELIRRLLWFVLALGLVQVFFAAYQLLVVVPSRVGIAHGIVAIDAVSGTFESTPLGGGSSSILVMFVLLAFGYVLRAWRDKLVPPGRAFVFSLMLLAPLFMGETKIVIVFLPLVVLVVTQEEFRRNPFVGLLILMFTAAITVGLGYLYLSFSTTGHEALERTIDRIIAYNFGTVGYHSLTGLNRTSVLTFWWSQQSLADPIRFLFGHGIGASYSGEASLVPGHLALKYQGLAIAFTGLSTLLWDLGLCGTLLFILIMIGAWSVAHRLSRRLPLGQSRAVLITVEAGLLMNTMLLFLSNSMFALPSHEVILMLLLAGAALENKRLASAA